MPNKKLLLIAIGLMYISQQASADHLPLWELGLSVGGIHMPAYRGSQQNVNYLAPLPYVSYRGEKLRVGREGIKGFLFYSERWALDMSLRVAPPVKSSETVARVGMEDLDATLEIGPSLSALLYRSTDQRSQLRFALPLRAVFGSDLKHLDHQGWTLYPHLNLTHQQPPHGQKWRISIDAGVVYGDDAYHDYFYGVDHNQSIASRPAYRATGGYSGARLTFNYRYYVNQDWIVRTYLQYENLTGAAFTDSPLYTSNQNHSVGFLISRIFKRSTRKVAWH